jgi:hypothetical protein
MNDAHHKAKNIDLWGSLQLINISHAIPTILLYQANMKIPWVMKVKEINNPMRNHVLDGCIGEIIEWKRTQVWTHYDKNKWCNT